jgi:hypothetical protein
MPLLTDFGKAEPSTQSLLRSQGYEGGAQSAENSNFPVTGTHFSLGFG